MWEIKGFRAVLAVAGVGALTAAAAPTVAGATKQVVQDVLVTNTAAKPVPVAGTVDVGSLPAAGVRPLQLGADPDGGGELVAGDGDFAATADLTSDVAEALASDELFEVQHVSGRLIVPDGQSADVFLRLADVQHELAPVRTRDGGARDTYVFSEDLTAYLADGKLGQLTLNRAGGSFDGPVVLEWAVSGRIVKAG